MGTKQKFSIPKFENNCKTLVGINAPLYIYSTAHRILSERTEGLETNMPWPKTLYICLEYQQDKIE